MCMLSHRLQVLIAPAQYERLRRESERRRTPIAAIVREAIDRALDDEQERKRAAWERLVRLEPIPVPEDPGDLDREAEGMFWDPERDPR